MEVRLRNKIEEINENDMYNFQEGFSEYRKDQIRVFDENISQKCTNHFEKV